MNKGFMRYFLMLALVLVALSGSVLADNHIPPTIITFTSDLESITVPEAEAGTQTTTLSWVTANVSAEHTLNISAYEITNWNQLNNDETGPLEANGSFSVTIRHPLNFNPPTYRLQIVGSDGAVFSERVVSIPYALPEPPPPPTPEPTPEGTPDPAATEVPSVPDNTQISLETRIVSFTSTMTSIDANELAYTTPEIPVSWEVVNRIATSHLFFEQVLPDNSSRTADFPRASMWVPSAGQGAVTAVLPPDSSQVILRLRVVDLATDETLDESAITLAITGTLSTPTPRPTAVPQPETGGDDTAASDGGAVPAGGNPAPVVGAGSGGGFELGGHVAGFGFADQMRSARMTWVKKQVRWSLGEGPGGAAGVINEARAHGFKVLLGIVGYPNQMGDYAAYTDAFAAYLGQVAALGPDAIEVWNEPNIEREWPTGTISGASYTQMLAKGYNAIKSVNPNVMVISGALAPTGFFGGCAAAGCDDAPFLRQMANAGAANYMDCIGAHYNEGIISPDLRSGDPRGGHYTHYFWGMLDTYYGVFGGARRVCWTELGYLSPEGYGPLPPFFSWAANTTVAQHAEWLGRAAALSRSSGRVRIMIIWNVDFRQYGDDPMGGYAIIRPDGGCPACGALAGAMG